MKKLAICAVAGILGLGVFNADAGVQDPNVKHEKQHKVTHNKVFREIGKGFKEVGEMGKDAGEDIAREGKGIGKGVEEFSYDVTHNKVTKETRINKGDQKNN